MPQPEFETNRDRAKALLNGRKVVAANTAGQAWQFHPERFTRFAEFMAEFGVTHVQVTLPFRYGSWVLPDNVDPYAGWCVNSVGILRLCPPPELQEWVPLDQAQAARAIIDAQLAILRPLGLKAVAHAVEPMWLPEGVYRAHPRWRGAQCELGRIASAPYFAPSIDEPEVRDLYRRAMSEFHTLFPEIDQFNFLSNDSGAGLGWAPCLYPGMNGPRDWRRRDGGARIADWLAALRAGAQEAGGTVRFNVMSSGLPPEWVASARAKLEPDLFVCSVDRDGRPVGAGGAALESGMWRMPYPVAGLGDPATLTAGLQSVYHNPSGDDNRATISVGEDDLAIARPAFEAALAHPGSGAVRRAQAAVQTATTLAGEAGAESLIGVWAQVAKAMHGMSQVRQKGFSLPFMACTVCARWLVRPLVPQPEHLTPEETAHYRDIMFAMEADRDDPNFGLILGKGTFRGEGVTWMSRWSMYEASNSLRGAAGTVRRLATDADADRAPALRLYADRLEAMACVAENLKNTVMYQYALDIRDQTQYGPNQIDYDDNILYDQRALTLRKIAREELDNTARLIELMDNQTAPVLEHAAAPEEENVFMFGPDLRAQLDRKMTIMLDHWQDYERLYPATKVWDHEPPAIAAPGQPDSNRCGDR